MQTKILLILMAVAVALLFILAIVLLITLARRKRLFEIYASPNRDERFANALLSHFFKKKLIKKPYILKDDSNIPPAADAVLVCGGGIVILSYLNGTGTFSTPDKGIWTRTDENGKVEEIPNLLKNGRLYTSSLINAIMRKSVFCPEVIQYVFLTDDYAVTDYRSSPSVMPGNRLIEELKFLSSTKDISSKTCRELRNIILNDSKQYQRSLLHTSVQVDTGSSSESEQKPSSNSSPSSDSVRIEKIPPLKEEDTEEKASHENVFTDPLDQIDQSDDFHQPDQTEEDTNSSPKVDADETAVITDEFLHNLL